MGGAWYPPPAETALVIITFMMIQSKMMMRMLCTVCTCGSDGEEDVTKENCNGNGKRSKQKV